MGKVPKIAGIGTNLTRRSTSRLSEEGSRHHTEIKFPCQNRNRNIAVKSVVIQGGLHQYTLHLMTATLVPPLIVKKRWGSDH